jgi:hypothetical protein
LIASNARASERAGIDGNQADRESVMGMQKYRADVKKAQPDGAIVWSAEWMGGRSLSMITNCRTDMAGDPRVTAYVTGEADTFFSIPAVCSYMGCRVRGYVTSDDDGLMFRVVYY